MEKIDFGLPDWEPTAYLRWFIPANGDKPTIQQLWQRGRMNIQEWRELPVVTQEYAKEF